MPSEVLVAIVTSVSTVVVAFLVALPKIVAAFASIRTLRRDVTSLRERVGSLERGLEAERQLTRRLLSILRRVLYRLDRHEPGASDAIRSENPDLDL